MTEHYLRVKFLHVLGVIIFLGNIIVTAFWKVLADRTKNWTIISYSQRLVTYTDIVFTLTGILLINTTGMIMAKNSPGFLSVNWIKLCLAVFHCCRSIVDRFVNPHSNLFTSTDQQTPLD